MGVGLVCGMGSRCTPAHMICTCEVLGQGIFSYIKLMYHVQADVCAIALLSQGSGPAALTTASSAAAAAAAAVHNERRALSALGTSPPHALAHSGSSSGSLPASTPHGLATQSAPPAGLASGSPTASLDASRISLSVSGPPGQGLTHGSGRVRYRHTVITRKSLIPTPEQLEALPLHEGQNTITYK